MKDILVQSGGTQLKDFLAALLGPLQDNTDLLKDFETEQTKHAKWNGQKIVLQAALNDLFSVTSAPYIIVETNQSTGSILYFYEPSENSPVYFNEPSESDPVYFFEPGELTGANYDFTVKIPVGIWTSELERQVKAQTNLYKLAGTRFNIITY